MSGRDRILRGAEDLDTYLHGRFRWSPRFVCDLAELSYGCPDDVPHNWRGGRPNRLALLVFRILDRSHP